MSLISPDGGCKCSICQDTELLTEMYALPCAHSFHKLCINEWLKRKTLCPICRLRIDNTRDEGLGDVYEFEDDLLSFESVVVIGRLELIVSGTDQESIIQEFLRASDEVRAESFEIGVPSNTSENIEPLSSELEIESEQNESDNNCFGIQSGTDESDSSSESNESCDEPESNESCDEPESNESCDEPEIVQSGVVSETNKSDEERETNESKVVHESTESNEKETSESDADPYTDESNSESKYESDSESDYETDSESDYETDAES